MTNHSGVDTEERIEQLVEELQRVTGAEVWSRIEELLAALIQLYGDGLERLLCHAAEVGALNEGLRARLCADDLVSNLLVLHGLHPMFTSERVANVIERVRTEIAFEGTIELLRIDPEGAAWLRIHHAPNTSTATRDCVEAILRATLERVAPELRAISVQDAASDASPNLRAGVLPS